MAYEIQGVQTQKFPMGHELMTATPVYEYLPGWCCDISGCRSWEELPAAAQQYILYLEKSVGCPIRYVSVGAGREEYLIREV